VLGRPVRRKDSSRSLAPTRGVRHAVVFHPTHDLAMLRRVPLYPRTSIRRRGLWRHCSRASDAFVSSLAPSELERRLQGIGLMPSLNTATHLSAVPSFWSKAALRA